VLCAHDAWPHFHGVCSALTWMVVLGCSFRCPPIVSVGGRGVIVRRATIFHPSLVATTSDRRIAPEHLGRHTATVRSRRGQKRRRSPVVLVELSPYLIRCTMGRLLIETRSRNDGWRPSQPRSTNPLLHSLREHHHRCF
jgi:hypothetical protein